MRGIREQIKLSHCVVLCIILGCSLRFVGLTRGDSSFVIDGSSQSESAFYHFHPDETALIQAAIDPIDPLSPKITSYGMLPIYLLRGVLEFNSTIFGQDFTNQKSPDRVRYVYFTARILAVLASCLTLYLVWLLGARWFSDLTGLLAVCVVAVAPIAIQLAHFYTVDGLFTLLILATVYVLLRTLERPDWRWYVLTGILIGLSAAVRLIGLSAGFILLVGHVIHQRQLKAVLTPSIWLAGLSTVLCLLALQPFLVLDRDLTFQDTNPYGLGFAMDWARGEFLTIWSLVDIHTIPYLYHWTHLWPLGVGWPLTILFIFGLSYSLWKIDHQKGLILLWIGIYFYAIGGLQAKPIRYLLPLLPFLALLSADFCVWFIRSLQFARARKLAIGICAAIFMYSTIYGVAFASLYTREDSRIQAARWIDKHIPANSRIGVERGGFSMRGMINSEKYSVHPIKMGVLFTLRGFTTCKVEFIFVQDLLRNLDYIAITDINRYQQFTATPELVPGGAAFYQALVDGEVGFDLVQRFRHYPSLGSIAFKDDGSEPTFVGFDHPTVMIFKKNAAYQQGIAHLQKQASTNPHCVDSLLETACSALQAGDLDQSLLAARRATDQFPQSKIAHLIAAEIHRKRGEEAMELHRAYWTEIARHLSSHWLLWGSGQSLLELGQIDLALSVLEGGTREIVPGREVEAANLYIALAFRLYERQEKEEAAKVLLYSTRIHPLPLAYNFLANIAVEGEDYKQALGYFEQSLQLDDKQANAHAAAGKIAVQFLNDQPKALYHFQRALELDPKLEADLSRWIN
ncbi:MAG: phospholipid carrier-dependent glycosyltransferase [Gemmatimonadetes bacterium]|nr:phospholipid carrier-dependent glycosyltransferase [Gemmatimonadota bacterium]